MIGQPPKPAERKPFLSGFCNPSNPPDSHRRCRRSYRGAPCVCPCHTTRQETP